MPQKKTKMHLDFRSNELHAVHKSSSEVYYYVHKEAEG
jgi:hypothetical protein